MRKRGDHQFQGGTVYFRNIWSPRTEYFEIFGPGVPFVGGTKFVVTGVNSEPDSQRRSTSCEKLLKLISVAADFTVVFTS